MFLKKFLLKAVTLPVHPATEGVSPAWMRRIMSQLWRTREACRLVALRACLTHHLISFIKLREVHFSFKLDAAEQARRRLAFDELLSLQLLMARKLGTCRS